MEPHGPLSALFLPKFVDALYRSLEVWTRHVTSIAGVGFFVKNVPFCRFYLPCKLLELTNLWKNSALHLVKIFKTFWKSY